MLHPIHPALSICCILFILLCRYAASYLSCYVDMLHPICTAMSICCILFVLLCRYAAFYIPCYVDMLHPICTAMSICCILFVLLCRYAASYIPCYVDMLHPIYPAMSICCIIFVLLCRYAASYIPCYVDMLLFTLLLFTTKSSVTRRRLIWSSLTRDRVDRHTCPRSVERAEPLRHRYSSLAVCQQLFLSRLFHKMHTINNAANIRERRDTGPCHS